MPCAVVGLHVLLLQFINWNNLQLIDTIRGVARKKIRERVEFRKVFHWISSYFYSLGLLLDKSGQNPINLILSLLLNFT